MAGAVEALIFEPFDELRVRAQDEDSDAKKKARLLRDAP